ncbi:TraB/GumN family protein [Clostridium sp.]|uniref:TraB/GumN family protein n=1 Tax=Clostridium sp. TaxID=1506 RepID=UPI002FC7E6F8
MLNNIITNIKKVKLKPFFNNKNRKAEGKICDGIFYKVEKDGKYFYVGGSIHIGKSSSIQFNELVEKAFEESTKLAVEIDNTKIKNFIGLIKEIKNISLNEAELEEKEQELDFSLEEKKNKFENLCKDLGLNSKKYSKISPDKFYVVAERKLIKNAGYRSKFGIDNIFIERAKKSKKEIVSLESPDIQLGAFVAAIKMSPECLSKHPKEMGTLESLEESIEELSSTHDAIFEGDISKLVNEILIYNPINERDKENLNKFLYHRNEMMVDNIENFIESGEICFAVVGAAHVIGKGGILKLFKDKGYTITRLK